MHIKYKIDFPVYLMVFGTFLDILTTVWFTSLGIGKETNPILAGLINITIWFIPIYLFSFIVLVPFLPEILRQTASYYFFLKGLFLGINNLFLILVGNAFLIDTIGILGYEILIFGIGFLFFIFLIIKNNLVRKEIYLLFFKAALFGIFMFFLEGVFLVLGFIISGNFAIAIQ